ncbi:MAG: hybrid sensor histidine kinase/response regulator [Betaproteobacteria bacterium]
MAQAAMKLPAESRAATLLIVDDKPQNLRLVSDFLAEQGFELMLTRSGAQALQKIDLAMPDLVLLDVTMPKMDGFEVCRRLKSNARTAALPVIFMTALDDTAHKVEGFRLGAVDYITKPIQREELLARIQHHLQLHTLQKELLSKSEDLAQKNAELEAYAHTIAHSLKTPLAAASRFLEILQKFKSEGLNEDQRHLAQQASSALSMTGGAVDALLLLSTVSQRNVEVHELDMDSLVGQVMSQLEDLRAGSRARIKLPRSWPRALGYGPWIGEVWLNLLSNALKYGGVPPDIEVGGAPHAGMARFWVRDNGTTLSDSQRSRVFIPFTRLHQDRAAGHGLGLATVQRIVARLGGNVGASARPQGGNEFYFSLPAAVRGRGA